MRGHLDFVLLYLSWCAQGLGDVSRGVWLDSCLEPVFDLCYALALSLVYNVTHINRGRFVRCRVWCYILRAVLIFVQLASV
jgi:hypothetical protein